MCLSTEKTNTALNLKRVGQLLFQVIVNILNIL